MTTLVLALAFGQQCIPVGSAQAIPLPAPKPLPAAACPCGASCPKGGVCNGCDCDQRKPKAGRSDAHDLTVQAAHAKVAVRTIAHADGSVTVVVADQNGTLHQATYASQPQPAASPAPPAVQGPPAFGSPCASGACGAAAPFSWQPIPMAAPSPFGFGGGRRFGGFRGGSCAGGACGS